MRITNNFIGPAGVGSNVEQMRWADGISYAASDGLVAGNLITDATDGGIGEYECRVSISILTSYSIIQRDRNTHYFQYGGYKESPRSRCH